MTGEKNDHTKIYELVMHASYQIRKKLGIDDLSCNVSVSNSKNPKNYYLQNVLNELDKSVISLMFACQFLDANKNEPPPSKEDSQFNSKILQSKIDELSLWRRKLVEILIDLIGFRVANSIEYYRHYNLLHEVSRKQKEFNDRKEFWGCSNKTLAKEIQDLESAADQLFGQLDQQKCWYTKKKKNNTVLNDEKSRFQRILEDAKIFQKALLLSYRNSFGRPSELLHPKKIVDEKDMSLEDFIQAIRGVGILGLHVISGIKDLLRIHNTTGSLKQAANAVKKNLYPMLLLGLRTKSKIVVNDYVITPLGPAQVKKKTSNKTKFGYRTFIVRLLIPQSSNIKEEEYIAEEIRLLAPYKSIKKEVLQILQTANPSLRVGASEINKALNQQVLELWELTNGQLP